MGPREIAKGIASLTEKGKVAEGCPLVPRGAWPGAGNIATRNYRAAAEYIYRVFGLFVAPTYVAAVNNNCIGGQATGMRGPGFFFRVKGTLVHRPSDLQHRLRRINANDPVGIHTRKLNQILIASHD